MSESLSAFDQVLILVHHGAEAPKGVKRTTATTPLPCAWLQSTTRDLMKVEYKEESKSTGEDTIKEAIILALR